jgi:hypothetical protein
VYFRIIGEDDFYTTTGITLETVKEADEHGRTIQVSIIIHCLGEIQVEYAILPLEIADEYDTLTPVSEQFVKENAI